MSEYRFGSRDSSEEREAPHDGDNKVQYLLSAEEQLLQLISSRAPLPEVLNGICAALDCQVANVVSLISLRGNDAGELGEIATNAALFGLDAFYSEGLVAENDELLGSLEMYCSDRRRPSAGELQLIERAKCLAAIAIKRHNEADHQGNRGVRGNRPVTGRVLEWPVSPN
jgi:hypothetical protein